MVRGPRYGTGLEHLQVQERKKTRVMRIWSKKTSKHKTEPPKVKKETPQMLPEHSAQGPWCLVGRKEIRRLGEGQNLKTNQNGWNTGLKKLANRLGGKASSSLGDAPKGREKGEIYEAFYRKSGLRTGESQLRDQPDLSAP